MRLGNFNVTTVQLAMLRPIGQLKVFGTVVLLLAVSVVNNLIATERTPKELFHNHAVLTEILLPNANQNITLAVINAPTLPVSTGRPRRLFAQQLRNNLSPFVKFMTSAGTKLWDSASPSVISLERFRARATGPFRGVGVGSPGKTPVGASYRAELRFYSPSPKISPKGVAALLADPVWRVFHNSKIARYRDVVKGWRVQP